MHPKSFNFFFVFLILVSFYEKGFCQYAVDVDYLYGRILPHNKTIKHLIKAYPESFLVSFSKKTLGDKHWQTTLNYPDIGISVHVQNNHNETLGNLYGIYGHYNFYFFNRNLVLRAAQGIAYTTNPYDKETNFRNLAYGSHWMPSTYFVLQYRKERIFGPIGFQIGTSFFHHSNANLKSPNTSTNTLSFQMGLNYATEVKKEDYFSKKDTVKWDSKIKYNFVVRTGINESDIIGSGQKPFFQLSSFITKKWNRHSAFQTGFDFFAMYYLKEYIEYKSTAFPNENINKNTDFKRIGLFLGYELTLNKLAIEAQLGYYLYTPFEFLGPFYQRVGAKYYWSSKFFTSVSLKTHGAKAEALEFGIGIQL